MGMASPSLKEVLDNLQEHSGKVLVVEPEMFAEMAEAAGQFNLGDEVVKTGLIGSSPEGLLVNGEAVALQLQVKCKCSKSSCWLERQLPDGRRKFISANPPGVAIARFVEMTKSDKDMLA